MKSPTKLVLFLTAIAVPGSLNAAAVFAPGDPIQGGAIQGTDFVIATAGTVAGVNNFPANESPDHAIDGVGQKYLNFFEVNTGVVVTPTFGGGLGSVVNSMTLWTANDAEPRDPASYEVYGTNSLIPIGGATPMSNYTLISSGGLALPVSRNGGGGTALDVNNSQTVNFANSLGYTSYLVVFPTVKNAASANSMQIAEIQLDGTAVPEPGVLALCGLSVAALVRRRRSS